MVLPTHRLSRRNFLGGLGTFFSGAVFISFGAPPGLAKKKKAPVPPPVSNLSTQIESLGRQLLATPLDESDPLTSQVQQLVLDDLKNWFAKNPPGPSADGTPYDVRVRREMEFAFSRLHYPVFGQPRVLSVPWNGSLITACGYTLGWSDFDRANVVAVYETRDGKTRRGGVDHFVQRTDLHFRIFPGPDSSSFRFLAYGLRLGKSQPRLSAALYGYDGHSLKSLWQVHDMYDGKLELDNGVLVIRYLKEEEYINALTYNQKPPRHMATYKPSAQGLTLMSDREIPF
ncbi:MAG TPA: hypothetical protein VG028_08905 [Terriglobia bacterium]|nr:hypothetical protein [Terriglobia bacterium]